jgi:ubiquinone/menaquinone biosynthesis C-methylase UbiE
MDHNEKIRKEFSRQADSFGKPGLTLSSQEYLEWMVDILPLHAEFRVLDVAAGTGHLSRAIAPHVRQVVAIDMTREMLEKAKEEAVKAGLVNILFEEGDAAALPYQDNSFDMVVSRLAMHHFENPQQQLSEMVRVCKPEHAVGIIDLLSPSDQALIASYNRLERMRDASHTMALTKEKLANAMDVSGLSILRIDTRDINVDFGLWVEMTGTDPQTRNTISSELEQELQGGAQTGMRPFMQDGKLKFRQTWCVAIGINSPNKRSGERS